MTSQTSSMNPPSTLPHDTEGIEPSPDVSLSADRGRPLTEIRNYDASDVPDTRRFEFDCKQDGLVVQAVAGSYRVIKRNTSPWPRWLEALPYTEVLS